MVVTAITNIDSKKSKITIDYDYSFPLYISEIRRYHLTEDTTIDDGVLSEIKHTLVNRIKNRILFFIEKTDKSIADVTRKMSSAYYPTDLIDEAVSWLVEYGYLDDVRYARNYIESMSEYKGRSRKDIVSGLYAKGISKDIIDRAVAEFEFDESAAIFKAIRKKGYSPEQLEELNYEDKNKLFIYLARKGFETKEIRRFFDTYHD